MKLVTILGQTCSGKTQMSLDLFRHFQKLGKTCWIVNCDSRQIYCGLNYGTAKVEGVWKGNVYWVNGDIPHYLIDYVEPNLQYNLSNYLADFSDLFRSEQPDYVILVGGTGLYAKAINEEIDLGVVKKDFEQNYNKEKDWLNSLGLYELQKLVSNKSIKLNESDYLNKIRLVSNLLRKESINSGWLEEIRYPKFEQKYYCAIRIEDQVRLQNQIKERIKLRINQGLVMETQDLILNLGSKRVDELGLEYRLTLKLLSGEITETEWIEHLGNENWQYAKRQLTWLKREKDAIWFQTINELIKNIIESD
jgi:tRNA dimethylallyltransferase